jgi:hypothetical protein
MALEVLWVGVVVSVLLLVVTVAVVVIIVAVAVMIVGVVMVVRVAVTGGLEHGEAETGGNQQAADDRVLRAGDGMAKLQADGDDHRAQHDRQQHVRHAGEP